MKNTLPAFCLSAGCNILNTNVTLVSLTQQSSCLCFTGINRALPAWERSRTEEDILRAALRPGSKQVNHAPTSTSEDSNALEWENDFVSTHPEDVPDAEFEGFVNPVPDTPSDDVLDCSLRSNNQDR